MIKILPEESKKVYEREIEGMGDNLVLLKIENKKSNGGYNFHLFYRNGKKPPFDVAINPNDNQIEYISFFIQDEKIIEMNREIDIIYENNSISISSKDFSIDNLNIEIDKEFNIFFNKRNLIIIEKNIDKEVRAYTLIKNNYILLKDKEISGFILNNITSEEISILKESKVL
jgi:hypothetical protein